LRSMFDITYTKDKSLASMKSRLWQKQHSILVGI
jgi:hypothetical protein